MIGQSIEARPPFSVGAAMWAGAGLTMLGLAAGMRELHFLVASVLPCTMAFVLWLRRPASVALLVDQDAIRPIDGRPEIPYMSIRSVDVPDLPGVAPRAVGKPEPLVIHHEAGHLVLPPVMNVPTLELYNFLQAKIPQDDTTSVHPILEEFYRGQIEKFGESKVHVANARKAFRAPPSRSTASTVGVGLFLGGALTLAAGVGAVSAGHKDVGYEGWIGFGAIVALIGGIVWLLVQMYGRRPNKALAKNPEACIVIAPVGLAMIQGDMRGTLRWEEITGTRRGAARFSDMPNQKGLEISIRGGRVIVYDIYDVPLAEMDGLICENLGQRRAGDAGA